MSFSVPAHLYRNRHGTFYFRHCIPKALRSTAGMSELRFSLGTQDRQTAIIKALPLIADLPRLVGCLQRMADTKETSPENFFKQWQLQMLESAKLRMDIHALKEEIEDQRFQMSGMVSRTNAQNVVKQAHTLGTLKGQSGAIERLEFPWAPERTKLFSELTAAFLKHYVYRAKGSAKKPVGAKTLEGYRLSVSEHASNFLLKGALLFTLWYDVAHRPTRDADLLGFGPDDVEAAVKTFRQICLTPAEDGVVFDPDSVKGAVIRKHF